MFEIINDIDRDIEELSILDEYVKYLVKRLELDKCEFNIIIVDNERIHEINREYRNVDRETDVISFAMEDNMDIEYKEDYFSDYKAYEKLIRFHIYMRFCFALLKDTENRIIFLYGLQIPVQEQKSFLPLIKSVL